MALQKVLKIDLGACENKAILLRSGTCNFKLLFWWGYNV